MKYGPAIAYVAALIGDPDRANMLTALMTGKALTFREHVKEAGVTVQTASSPLSKLDQGGLVRPRKQGRHEYFTIASDKVAGVLEDIMGLAADRGRLRTGTGPKDFGLYNMIGNVWEWTADRFTNLHSPHPVRNPSGPLNGGRYVAKGGSYLCHASYCTRYRTSSRQSLPPNTTTGNLGFRLARSPKSQKA
jgi:DNA-binding transcriptional ArsR family regulator